MNFDYFYNRQTEIYNFIRPPIVLMEDEGFRGISEEFSQMETTKEIAMEIEENTLNMMEKDQDFMERFPNPTYAVLRLSYLVMSEDEKNWKKLQVMYEEGALLNHLKEIQIQAVDFIKREKDKMMKTQGLTEDLMREKPEDYQGQMNNLIATIKKMAIKEYVEV